MDAKKCDRCGAFYNPLAFGKAWRYSVVKDCHPYPEHKVDLCNNCRLELEMWLEGDKKTHE